MNESRELTHLIVGKFIFYCLKDISLILPWSCHSLIYFWLRSTDLKYVRALWFQPSVWYLHFCEHILAFLA